MTQPPTRYRTGDPEVDRRLVELLDSVGATANRDQLFEILTSGVLLAGDGADRLDLKITNAALREMRSAYRLFAPYRHVPKVTIFGSARTLPDDPLYRQARDLAARLAERGWYVVTGAGPGIMGAGTEGAGVDRAFGVHIRLPAEEAPHELITEDKLVEMKYFFTRKLMLMKESLGFVCLPGGFGTLDETFELLTLQQTGKAEPAPIVLLDVPEGTYWARWAEFVEHELAGRGLVGHDDAHLAHVTDDVDDAVDVVDGFYRNFQSIRWVGERVVVRLRAAPTEEELAVLNDEFGDLPARGTIEATEPLAAEVSSNDHLDLPRVVLRLDPHRHARFHAFIRALNTLESAPADGTRPSPAER